jgi:hypothetical protein
VETLSRLELRCGPWLGTGSRGHRPSNRETRDRGHVSCWPQSLLGGSQHRGYGGHCCGGSGLGTGPSLSASTCCETSGEPLDLSEFWNLLWAGLCAGCCGDPAAKVSLSWCFGLTGRQTGHEGGERRAGVEVCRSTLTLGLGFLSTGTNGLPTAIRAKPSLVLGSLGLSRSTAVSISFPCKDGRHGARVHRSRVTSLTPIMPAVTHFLTRSHSEIPGM